MSVKEYTGDKIQLPSPEDVPHLQMEVLNFHRPMLGTFHAKLCVIDRKIGLLQSNNVQDNDNLEMMVQLEGPIVDSMYDTLLISWEKQFEPALPMIASPAAQRPLPTFDGQKTESHASSSAQDTEILPENTSQDPHYDQHIAEEARRVNSQVHPRPNESRRDAISRHLSKPSSTRSKRVILLIVCRQEDSRPKSRRPEESSRARRSRGYRGGCNDPIYRVARTRACPYGYGEP